MRSTRYLTADRAALWRSAICASRTILGAMALAGSFALATGFAWAQSPSPNPESARRSPAAPAEGCARAEALGVSRVVQINTAGGQLFGQQQYKDNDFLEDGEVVLTFDDGPLRPYTTAVLQALEAHCTKATFFVVGRMAVADPDMVREIARRGHTIGTHTWSHRNQRTLGASAAKGEVELAISTASKTAGQPIAPFFRFPYLADSRFATAHLKSRDNGIFSIDVDSRDFRTRNPAEVQRVILSQLAQKRKGILLFHDIQPSTAGALKSLLAQLKARGFKVVHMISKMPATTLPEYDALADAELRRKQLAAARSPLANRAIVWPIAADTEEPARPPAGLPVGTSKSTRPSATQAPAAQAPPPAVQPPPTAEAAPPPSRPRWRTPDEEDWHTKLFRN